MKKTDGSKPILPKPKVGPLSKRRVGDGTGPPIDDQVCVPKPPATGSWKLVANNGIIQSPVVWEQN